MSGMLKRSTTLSPQTTFVYIVGVCGEWQNGRTTEGDIALHNTLLIAGGIPRDHICHIKDKDATRSNVINGLKRLLSRTGPGDTLEVYFGGHGSSQGVGMYDKKLWKYVDMVRQIERQFRGDRAVFLMDTCHAGALGKHLFARSKILRVSYAFIGSTQSDSLAGGKWTLTASLIDAIRGKAGLDRYSDGVIDFADFVSYTADRHAREKKNRISVQLFGQFRPNTVLFTIPDPPAVPRRKRWPGDSYTASVRDRAFVKYEGGYEQQNGKPVYIPPNWYPCTVQRYEASAFAVLNVTDEFGNTWSMSSSPPNLLPGDYFKEAIHSGGNITELLQWFRTPSKMIMQTAGNIFLEASSDFANELKKPSGERNIGKSAAKVALAGTVGAVGLGVAVGANIVSNLAKETPMFGMLKRGKERRKRRAKAAQNFMKSFFS
eukprot:g8573.t1